MLYPRGGPYWSTNHGYSLNDMMDDLWGHVNKLKVFTSRHNFFFLLSLMIYEELNVSIPNPAFNTISELFKNSFNSYQAGIHFPIKPIARELSLHKARTYLASRTFHFD